MIPPKLGSRINCFAQNTLSHYIVTEMFGGEAVTKRTFINFRCAGEWGCTFSARSFLILLLQLTPEKFKSCNKKYVSTKEARKAWRIPKLGLEFLLFFVVQGGFILLIWSLMLSLAYGGYICSATTLERDRQTDRWGKVLKIYLD